MSRRLSFRDELAVRVVRVVNSLARRRSHGSGTVLGGRAGLLLSPDLLSHLARRRQLILVSGTNGKTTTTAMIATGWGGPVATNTTGANMPQGHVAALASSTSEAAVLEVDEAWLPEVVRATRPRVLALLNLSRDQLDRASEVRQVAERWRGFLSELSGTVVVANANDPLVVYAGEVAPHVAWCDLPTPWRTDAASCPHCTMPLHFSDERWWSDCGFRKPTTLSTTLREGLSVQGTTLMMSLALPGEFNEANAAVALTCLSLVGADLGKAMERLNALSSVAGRFSLREWRGHRMRLLLAKNPAGFAATLATLESEGGDVWIAINARMADGRDPSWLYDVPFEILRGRRVFCFGDRRLDLAVRLEYADVQHVVVDDPSLLEIAKLPVPALANYTAFQEWYEGSNPC